MVDYLQEYKQLLTRAVKVYDDLIRLYSSDGQVAPEWAASNAGEADRPRRGLTSYLAGAPSAISAGEASTFVVSTGHYLDDHWGDYDRFPGPDPVKRSRLEALHAELETIVKSVGQIYNALRQP